MTSPSLRLRLRRAMAARRPRARIVAEPPAADLRGVEERLAALDERLDRMERHQARFVETVTAQTQRADVGLEDAARAIEALRRRLEALERGAGR